MTDKIEASKVDTPDSEQTRRSSPCYADRVGNFTPIHPLDMANKTGLPIEDVMQFFEAKFGGYAAYVRQCEDKEQLGKSLAIMAGDESA